MTTVTVTTPIQRAMERARQANGIIAVRELWAIRKRFIDVGTNIIIDAWEEVPRWHFRRWQGYGMRRLVWDAYTIGGRHDGEYQYMTYRDCALSNLEEHYG